MLAFLSAVPLVWRLVSVGAVVLTLCGAVTWWSVHEYNKGWNAHAAYQAKIDQEKANEAEKSRAAVDACRSSGGVWRQTTGQCEW